VPVAAQRRSGKTNRGVPGLRLGSEHEDIFAAVLTPIPQSQDGSEIAGMSEPFRSMWQEAMNKELAGMRERRAFHIVDESELPTSARPIDLRCVFNSKTVDGGAFDWCKVSLVVKGFKQRSGIDHQETWASTGRMMTVRARFAHAVVHKHDLCQADVTQAFLHRQLDKPMWGRLPDGTAKKIWVAIYGTKQSANAWWRRSVEAQQGLGCKRMSEDPAANVAHT
jgi:hypothetical protein